MNSYQHPYKDVDFVIRHLLNFDAFCEQNEIADMNSDFTGVILAEAAKFATNQLDPLNQKGDLEHPVLKDGQVIETPQFAAAYQEYVAQGWASLSASEAYGGQGLANILSVACNEIWQSTNMAFSLCPLLGQGAITAIERHGSEYLKEQYLAKLISGEWTGTMNLTEAAAGTDLAAIKTQAVYEDGHYKISGQKIFITWGDHQMAENIIHLVLARLPDAPAGMKGISLFVVPKYLANEQGEYSIENDVRCLSLEHKLGIHGSPTCVMSYGDKEGAVGYLVGEEHCGIRYMFSMMNHARQGVGVQGLGVSERAYQAALDYACERIQGSDKAGNALKIIQFGDVRRMLMAMKSGAEAMRVLCYYAGLEVDKEQVANSSDEKAKIAAQTAFLTPVVKGWCTELTQEMVSFAMQVHGGAGYIEETGVAQYVRDARILTIYEGTTGIQALDFTQRKTLLDNAAQAQVMIEKIEKTCAQNDLDENVKKALNSALADAKQGVEYLLENSSQASFVANYYLQMWGYTIAGWLMAKAHLAATKELQIGAGDSEYLTTKQVSCKFYCEHFLVRTQACLASIRAGGDSVMSLTEEQFFSHVN